MKGSNEVTDIPGLSEVRRSLLGKYQNGEFPQTATRTKASNVEANPESMPDRGQKIPVVPIQVGGSRRHFFFLHGDYKGGALHCFPLARNLGSDQPLYALN